MKKALLLALMAFSITCSLAGSVQAAGITYGQVPPSSVIVNHGGLEWIWAAPCSDGPGSCGQPTKLFGFDDPTLAEWGAWSSRADLIAAFTNVSGGPICGSPYMSAFHSHCDYDDMTNGHIWGAAVNGICDPAYFSGCTAGTTETFFVRATPPVPEPGTYAMLASGLVALGYRARRRQFTRL